MPTTPTYGLRYLALTDPPNLASATQNLATDVEAVLAARMGCSLRRVAAQTLPDTAFTAVTWDTEDADTDGLFPGSGFDITIPANGAGVWAVSATVFVTSTITGLGAVRIAVGGIEVAKSSGTGDIGGTALTLPLSAGALVKVEVFADTAAGTTMTAKFHCYRVSA